MDSDILFKPANEPSQPLSVDHHPDHPYTLDIDGTTVKIRFAGTESLNSRLAGVFGAMPDA